MTSDKCPQCQKEINESTNRLIQDTCGHKKCRVCLLQDENGCKICYQKSLITLSNNHNLNISSTTSVIRYDLKSKNCTNEKVLIRKTTITECDNTIEDNQNSKKLPNHILIISDSPVSYKCSICLKSFSTTASVKYHAYCTGIERPLKCEICQKGFISRSHLETHKLKHSGLRPFSCTVCQKSFMQKSKLNRHMKLHTGEKPFVCSECGKKFSNKDALNGHYRTHNGDKPFSCNQCGNTFNNKSNLTKHLSTHIKEKLFMCEECGKKFTNKWALVAHGKYHNQKRSHVCQKCGKAFTNLKDLKRHGLIHLEIKPYGCKLCSMKFCRKDNLERHLKNTHSIKNIDEIRKACTKITVNKTDNTTTKKQDSINIKSTISFIQPSVQTSFTEKPNAINVIKMSNELPPTTQMSVPVPVINGPIKLAFKTDAFKNNYNILKRDLETPPRIQTKKYDMAESLNICQKILLPMNAPSLKPETIIEKPVAPPPVIMSVGKVNEKDSLEICKKILTPSETTPIHYETSFEHKKHAEIKNIKFKLPPTYTNNAIKMSTDLNSMNSTFDKDDTTEKDYIELQTVRSNFSENLNSEISYYQQSVIVNPHCSDVSNMHWRRRTSQNLQPKLNTL